VKVVSEKVRRSKVHSVTNNYYDIRLIYIHKPKEATKPRCGIPSNMFRCVHRKATTASMSIADSRLQELRL